MTRIVVNPESLKQSANKLKTVADVLHQKSEELKHTTENAPSYDGQFGPLVFGISISAQVRSRKDISRFEQHSGNLIKRADAFLLADTAGAVSLLPRNLFPFPFYNFPHFINSFIRENCQRMVNDILRLGSLHSQPIGMCTGFVFHKEVDLGQSRKVVDQLENFKNSDVARELAAAALAAGLLFIVMDGGKEVARWGKVNGKPIEISIGPIKDKKGNDINAYGEYDPDGNTITLNEKNMNEDTLYSRTLPHEMQHAIDFHTITDNELLAKEINPDMSITEIEDLYASQLGEYVKTEINAADVGYTNANNYHKYYVDRTDGVYTKPEIDFIIYQRDYEDTYENWINDNLKKAFGEETSYRADVWVDATGNMKVDINQSRNPVAKAFDDSSDDFTDVSNYIIGKIIAN